PIAIRVLLTQADTPPRWPPSLRDALPISPGSAARKPSHTPRRSRRSGCAGSRSHAIRSIFPCSRRKIERIAWLLEPAQPERRERSEEHTSELQSRSHLVCRLLLEQKTRSG